MNDEIASREFNAGSFEKLLERRGSRLRDYLDVPGCVEPEQKCATAGEAILKILQDRERGLLKVSAIEAKKLEEFARHFAVNRSIEKSGLMERTDNPGLSHKNLVFYFWKMVGLLRDAADRVETREGVEWQLDRMHIRIRDSDTTRLLVYEINKDTLVPKVIVIPNEHKRSNPFFALLEADAPMPTTVMRVLRAFSR